MAQRPISAFFTPTTAAASSAAAKKDEKRAASGSLKKKRLEIKSDSEDDADAAASKNVDNADVVGNSGPADQNETGRKGNDNDSKVDLSLPVPHRKTARKSLKRKNEAHELQEGKLKKLKAKESSASASNEEIQKRTDDGGNTVSELEDVKTESEIKTEPEPMQSEDSPVKVKSRKNRILSDSEDDSPEKKPVKSEKTAESTEKPKKVASIFSAAKKSPKREPKSSVQSPKKEKDSESTKPLSSSKSPKPSSSIKSPKKEKESESPKPSTSGTSKTKNAFAGFFSPKGGSSSGGGKGYDGKDYNSKVKKSQYNPIEDCFWKKGDKTPYLALANTFLAIEETSGRLKTIEILSNYFRSVMVLTPEDLMPSIYLTLNRLAPAWEGIELGIGETLLLKAIANTTGRTLAQVKLDMEKLGDLGIVAEKSKGLQRTMFQPAPLTVESVFSKLRSLAAMTGQKSSNVKVEKVQSLLVSCRGSESRYLIRSLAGKLRIGLAEQSVLQALAQACLQTPLLQNYPPTTLTAFKSSDNDAFKEKLAPLALKLKTAYCECPSYDILVPALLEAGIDGLESRCKLTPGIPLKPMLAHPTKGVQEVLTRFENCKFTCEWKYDGERAQIHLHEDGTINIYSRNQEDNTTKYPDIINRFNSCKGDNVKSLILDCEAVAWDKEKGIQPFQILSTRKRKDAVESEIKVQVCLFGFDLLYLNGERLVNKNFQERRDLLRENLKEVEGEFYYAKGIDGTSTEEIQVALEDSIKDNCEGLMVKALDHEATYEIARRSHNWLKLKKDYLDGVSDTIDLVVLGGFLGKGKRTGGYGGFLLGCYDAENEEYQSICKIGTGFTDEDLQKHAAFFKDHVIPSPKSYYNYDSGHTPDHWFEPVQVWEVKCADLSISPSHKAAIGIVDPEKGISLRFPRFITIRTDKNAEDATSAEQIAYLYNNQDQIKNQKKGKTGPSDADFDF